MPARSDLDPRTERGIEEDVRPAILKPRPGLSTPLLVSILVLVGTLLFLVLNARRQAAPSGPANVSAIPIQAPPPLVLPPAPLPASSPLAVAPQPQVIIQTTPAPSPLVSRAPEPTIMVMPNTGPVSSTAPERAPQPSSQPALVIDTTIADVGADTGAATARASTGAPNGQGTNSASSSAGQQRARATMFRNRATTVAQGTLIPAVLDTALDSSRPGLARAVVSRDARGFDGTRVLIPRGSRLLGEYRSDAQLGQRRVLVTWTRLIRPDGATIMLDSPAGDPLGRGGIGGQVDTHFLERFGGAILQSVLELGVNVATARVADGNVILGVPNQLGGLTGLLPSQQIPPTIKVRQGTAVTIFVARDLDFTGVEGRP